MAGPRALGIIEGIAEAMTSLLKLFGVTPAQQLNQRFLRQFLQHSYCCRPRELGLSEALVPLAFSSVAVIAMVFSTPLAAWSDRVGRKRLLTIGGTAYGLVYLGLGLAPPATPWLFFALLALYGLFMAATEGVERALVADLAPEALRGRPTAGSTSRQGSCYCRPR